jgi:hypothetical protein
VAYAGGLGTGAGGGDRDHCGVSRSALSGDEELMSDTESRRADELRFERFAGERGQRERGFTEVVVVRSATATVDEPRIERRVRARLRRSCVEPVRLR